MTACRLQFWVLLFCAAALLLAQFSGAHYHRHLGAPSIEHESGTSVHLRDAGVHVVGYDSHHAHHHTGDHAEHPGVDLEIDSTGSAPAKVGKSTLLLGLILAFVLWQLPAARTLMLPRHARTATAAAPPLFSLRPPSHAPPFVSSHV